MTVPTSDNREQYQGNDSATEFDYAFKIFKADDLVVTLTDSDGNESTLTRGTDYSVDGVGNENGGSVTYPLSGDPLATGETLTILREIPVVQETDLRNQGRYYPETLEDEFDRSRMIDQQQQEQLGRTLSRTRASDYFDAKGRRIADVGNAVEDQDAYTKGQADARFANDVITQTGGEWDAKSDPLGNLGNPQDPDHATTKAYVDGRFDTDVITKTGTHWDAELQQIRNLQTRQPPSSTDAMNFGATSLHVANVLNSADPQTDGWQRVRWVNTIADLQALPTSELVDGQAISITTTGRAGDFVVRVGDFSAEVSGDPEHGVWSPFDDNPSGNSIAAKRETVFVTPEMFGASGDGVSDDTVYFQSAVSSGWPVSLVSGNSYNVNGQITFPANLTLVGFGEDSTILSNYPGYWALVNGQNYLENIYCEDSGVSGASAFFFPAGSPGVKFNNVRASVTDAAIGFDADGGSGFTATGGSFYTSRPQGVAAAIRVLGTDTNAVPRHLYGVSSGGATLVDFGGCDSFYIFGGYSNGFIFSSPDCSKVQVCNMRIGAAGGAVYVRGSARFISCISSVDFVLTDESSECHLIRTEVPDWNIIDQGSNNSFDIPLASAHEKTFLCDTSGNPFSLQNSSQITRIHREGRRVSFDYELTLGSDSPPGGEWAVKLPYRVSFSTYGKFVCQALLFDDSGRTYFAMASPVVGVGEGVDVLRFYFNDSPSGNNLSSSRPFAWSDGAKMRITCTYTTVGAQNESYP